MIKLTVKVETAATQFKKRQPKCLYRRWPGNRKCQSTLHTLPFVT